MMTRKMRPAPAVGRRFLVARLCRRSLVRLHPYYSTIFYRRRKRQMRHPAGEQGHQDGDDTIGGAVPVRKVVDIGAEADLADDQRRGLGADDLLVAHQIDFGEIGAGRHRRGHPQIDPEQPVADEQDARRLVGKEACSSAWRGPAPAVKVFRSVSSRRDRHHAHVLDAHLVEGALVGAAADPASGFDACHACRPRARSGNRGPCG